MDLKAITKRIGIILTLSIILGWLMSEVAFVFLKSEQDRGPQVITLVIPPGTSARVARGEANLSLPESMVFVVGDILSVKNEDTVNHRLGPLFIPAGSSAILKLDQEQTYSYQCSFQPGSFFGIDVHEPVTLTTRVVGILEAGVPMGILIALYTFVWGSGLKKASE
jgi:hypothetical protein